MCQLSVTASDLRRDDPERIARLVGTLITLFEMPDDVARMAWIERQVASTEDFPAPDRQVDTLRLTMLRWWLEMHDRQPVPPVGTMLFGGRARPSQIFT